MFCTQSSKKSFNSLNCNQKGLAESIAFISLICSLFVVIVTKIKLKPALFNYFIIQIIVSEIFDELNILSGILMDQVQYKNFENYDYRMSICFSQIYIGLFTCLWTLTASFFLSLKLYDTIFYRKKIFSNNFLQKYSNIFSILFPAIISYIFWAIQVTNQSLDIGDRSGYYSKTKKTNTYLHFRHIYCFIEDILLHLLFSIVLLLIIANSFLSFKSWKKVSDAKKAFISINDESRESIKQNLKKMNEIQNSLFLYPILANILWISFFILNYFFDAMNDNRDNYWFQFFSWVYSALISLRQLSYTLLYFFTNGYLKEYFLQIITCKTCKKNKNNNIKISKFNISNDPKENILEEDGGEEEKELQTL